MKGIIRLASILFLTATLTACTEEETPAEKIFGPKDGPVWKKIFNEEEISVEVGQEWYSNNKTDLMDLHQLLLMHPAIKRVTPGQKLEFAPKYEEFDPETETAYREAERRAAELGIITISVYRSEDIPSNEANSISYVLRTRGLSFTSNSVVKIEYNSDQDLLARYESEAFRKVVPLDVPDWYVHQYDKE